MTDWFETTIGHQITLQRGFDITKAEQRTGDVPVISSGGISSYHDTPMVHGPGVILGRKGTLGTVFYVEEDFWPHDTTLWVKDFFGNDPRFVYYFFRAIADDLRRLNVGTSNPTLNRNHVHPLRTLWPSLHVQSTIAAILGALDDKIALNRSLSTMLETTAAALFRSWFVDFDPVTAKADGHRACGVADALHAALPSTFQETQEGPIPSGWNLEPIGALVRCVGGSTPSTSNPGYWKSGAIRWATPRDMAGLWAPVIFDSARRITEQGLDQISSGLLPRGTVLLSSRAPIGYLAVTAQPMAVNQGIIAMICNGPLPNWYVYHWVHESMETIISRANGTTFLEISKRNFKPIPALRPPAELLSAFVMVVEPLHLRIEANVRENQALGALRDALLPQLLSGSLRLRTAEKLVEAAV